MVVGDQFKLFEEVLEELGLAEGVIIAGLNHLKTDIQDMIDMVILVDV